jgi:hypothetical protein
MWLIWESYVEGRRGIWPRVCNLGHRPYCQRWVPFVSDEDKETNLERLMSQGIQELVGEKERHKNTK